MSFNNKEEGPVSFQRGWPFLLFMGIGKKRIHVNGSGAQVSAKEPSTKAVVG